MRFRQRKAEPSNIRDPQLEYARLARQQLKRGASRENRSPAFPPPAVDVDFCFTEDVQK